MFEPPPAYAAPALPQTASLSSTGPPTHRPGLARGTLLLVVIVAVLLGVSVYLVLDAVHLVSLDPLAGAGGWIVLLVLTGSGAVALLVIAVIAVFVCRPRTTAVVALFAALLLPTAAVTIAGYFGLEAVSQHTRADLADGAGVAASALSDLLGRWGVDSGPLRDLVKSVSGS